MLDPIVVLSLVELLVGAVAVIIGRMAWRYRDRPGGTGLTILAVGITGWAFASALQSLVSDPTYTQMFSHMVHPFAALSAVGSFYMTVEYTDSTFFQQQGVLAAALGYFLVVGGLVASQPFHQGFVAPGATVHPDGYYVWEAGSLFWIHIAGAFILIGIALWLLLRDFLAAEGIYRDQLGAITAGGFIALALIAFQQFARDALPPYFSFSVLGLAILSATALWAMFEADFLETVPVARETLVENMDDALLAVNEDGVVVDVNPAAKSLLDTDQSVIGSPAREAFDTYPELYEWVDGVTEGQEQLGVADGEEERHFDITISPLSVRQHSGTDEPATVGRLILLRDVTETVRRKEQLEAQKQELESKNQRLEEQKTLLERQNERLDRFASVISHDLRNPLNSASGFLELARETGDEDHFERVERSHDRMETMVDELLTLARAETDVEDPDTVRLVPHVEEAWEMAETDGADLECSVPEDWRMAADADLLSNVLENLFRNAADHNEPPVAVRVGVLNGDAGEGDDDVDGTRGFFVEDDGEGIPPEDREDVFEHGYSTASSGTGFGLSIVSELAEAHDWEIDVTEGDEGGARFEITGVEQPSA